MQKSHLTCCTQHDIFVTCNKEVIVISEKSRADYFKERREKFKAFHVEVERERMEAFEQKLSEKKQSKKEWLDEKISDELKE